jgi:hypothetical protein
MEEGAVVAGRQTDKRVLPLSGGNGTGKAAPRAYRYRGPAKPDPAAARAREVLALLAGQRKTIALRSSRIRALVNELHDRIGQAVCDGVKVAAVAQVSGMPPAAVRTSARTRDDLYPSGQTPPEHLCLIEALAAELRAAESARNSVEQKRTEVLALARKSRLLDDYQLACASGLKHEEIRKMTRGVGCGAA